MEQRESMLWDLSTLPAIIRSGYFPMMPSSFKHTYQARTHAIHMYDYSAKFRISGEEYELQPGDITFSPAGLISAYELARQGGHWCIHFHLPPQGGPAFGLPLHIKTGPRAAYYRDRFKTISTYHYRESARENQKQIYKTRASAIFLELVMSLSEPGDSQSRPRQRHSDRAMEALLSHIEGHLDAPLSALALAEKASLSQNYLASLFRRQFNMSIRQYILSRRMESAKHLLQTTPATIKLIGNKVGIPDAQHFNKCFRRHVGMAPSRYRNDTSS
ncbi:MAG: hypothetical protein C0404_06360 [Verrucomicrobia bacterium]|nr:hypothetical protein [Verrucomicrobiota bacterium]